ncbi:MAG: hypothetical protein ACLP8S_22280 [Solirubrobacteraceae bacterium]
MNATDRPVPAAAAGELAERFERDQALAVRQNDALDRLRAANERLWSGLHPDALALVYDELPAGGGRSEVLDAQEPLRAVQEAGVRGLLVQKTGLSGLRARRCTESSTAGIRRNG